MNRAEIRVRNEFKVNATITLKYFRAKEEESKGSWSVAPGKSSPTMRVSYETWSLNFDQWEVEVKLPDGSIWRNTTRTKLCNLTVWDRNRTLTFSVSPTHFKIFTASAPPCIDSMIGEFEGKQYNALAYISVQNNLPVEISGSLKHTFQSFSQELDYNIPAASSYSEYLIAYYNTGNMWENAWEMKFSPQKVLRPEGMSLDAYCINSTSNKWCMLMDVDCNKVHVFEINANKLVMNVESSKSPLYGGVTTDSWKTPSQNNTSTFVYIRNNFSEDIEKAVVEHQHGGGTTQRFTIRGIERNKNSRPMWIEYNTGRRNIRSDSWGILISLANGKILRNSKAEKNCMLKKADSKSKQRLEVNDLRFRIDLDSGKCDDTMVRLGDKAIGISDVQPGDILVKLADKSIVNKGIAFGQSWLSYGDSAFTHAGLVATPTKIIEAEASGVVRNDLTKEYIYVFYRHSDPRFCEAVAETAKLLADMHQESKVLSYSVTKAALSSRANESQNLDQFWNESFAGKKQEVFCSQLVVLIFNLVWDQFRLEGRLRPMPEKIFKTAEDAMTPGMLKRELDRRQDFSYVGVFAPGSPL